MGWKPRRSAALLAAALLAAAGLAACSPGGKSSRPAPSVPPPPSPTVPARPAGSTVVPVAGTRLGPVFGGVGAISGWGGNSRYLIDYPPRQRAAILDSLSEPRDGAVLQMLKIEIGGNGNSSDGSEPSVEQVPGQVDCHVGCESWLARQALRRNPGIELYGLQWSAPRWVRSRAGTLWTAADIRYLLDWLGCARRAGLPISYLGGWNEHYTPRSAAVEGWYIALRHALDAHGYRRIRIVASDAAGFANATVWSVAGDMAANPAFARAIAVIGVHDVCGAESHGARCSSTPTARRLSHQPGKLLWQSEFGRIPTSMQGPLQQSPAGLARTLDNEYIDAGITGVLRWPWWTPCPPASPSPTGGSSPQTSRGAAATGSTRWPGSSPTRRSSTGPAGASSTGPTAGSRMGPPTSPTPPPIGRPGRWWSRPRPPPRPTPLGAPHGRTPPRRARLGHAAARTRPPRRPRLAHRGPRVVVVRARPGAVYTFTSTTGQTEAGGTRPPIPPDAPLPLPYAARPDGAGMGALLSPMEGSFGYVHGTLTQTTVGAPVPWIGCDVEFPCAVVGASHWRDCTVAATVRLPSPPAPPAPPAPTAPGARRQAPGAILIARFSGFQEACGSRLTAGIDGRQVASVVDTVDRSRLAGIGATGFDAVAYTNLTVR